MSEKTKDTKGRNLYKGESQMPDGRCRYRYIDKTGKRRAVYSWRLVTTDRAPEGKKREACLREKETAIMRDLQDGLDMGAQNMTVNDLLSRYLETKIHIANSTKENYLFHWNKDIKENDFGKMRIRDVKKSTILMFYAYLYQNRNLGPGTIQLFQNLLFPAFQMAVEDSVIRLNPCKGCMKDYSTGEKKEKIPLTKEEQAALLDFLKNQSSFYERYYSLVATILGTGMRIGEALGLTWRDIDFDRGIITVDHQLIYKKKDGKTKPYITKPKGKKSREIPLSKFTTKVLLEHKSQTYMASRYSGYILDGYSEFVFINRELKVHKPETIVRALHGVVNEYNKDAVILGSAEVLPDFTPHTLRHTFCTRMAELGMDVKVLQEIMGHKNIAITMQIYNHVNTDRAREEMRRIEDAQAVL